MSRDAAQTLRRVAELRALCLRLPHLPTEAEAALLQRFDALTGAPESVAEADVEVVAAGWRRWWRSGEIDRLRAMADRLPPRLVACDRRLASYALAAGARPPSVA
jgi:hypothetical protein